MYLSSIPSKQHYMAGRSEGKLLSTKLLTECHHKSNEVEHSLHKWKVGKYFLVRQDLKTNG